MGTRAELEKAFGELIVEARRTEMTHRDRDRFVAFLEREIRLILEPLDDDGDVWSDLGFRRAAR
ncbi:hypothetical protein BDS110ZK23_20550 [Bradyrhizobium diazoefficiens]|uniref:Uncharacterized protein n=1 Tax=Bradyrhizobium diazoefficiens TaxID=1355477 RepID=A0A810CAW9_9BRAD|nr:hypothetical protein XF2B_40660 [Bradyrhizobium diazoefficiens]BCE85029.1 hypothetical protein XF9B_64500 [Bradyrhizobium diazoefficiens]BCF00061.1 hypothetical protein XF11B_40810 [Bradyrhizobium diazoefficiens]BCF11128.1 hypothetical protein XF12B_65010 [Bradyrhizobium diazoefficiens]BCF17367.1 hypothetical protein XF13B_40580 [Bradyrhizobium diazoefficiens]